MPQTFVHALMFLILATSQFVEAQSTTSCWPNFTSANSTITFVSSSEVGLFTENITDRYQAPASLSLTSHQGEFLVKIRSTANSGEYHLPFNLYALLILKDGEPYIYKDLTKNCSSAGVSIFPGDAMTLSAIKSKHHPDSRYKVLVWGR